MQYYNRYDENQLLFDKVLHGLRIVLKVGLKILIYLPFLVTAYFVTTYILPLKAQLLLIVGLTSFIAYILYQLIYFLKGATIALKADKNLLWLPLFVIIVAFTCILPVWLMYGPVSHFMDTTGAGKWLTWLILTGYGFYIYSRFSFLANRSPKTAYFSYHAGIKATMALLKKDFKL